MNDIERAQRTIDSVFNHRGLVASYVPPGGGAAVVCRAIKDFADRDVTFGSGKPVVQGRTIDVRKSDLASPAKGGVITVGDEVLKVLSSPISEDPYRLIWSMTVAP